MPRRSTQSVADRWLSGDTGVLAATDSAEARLLAAMSILTASKAALKLVGAYPHTDAAGVVHSGTLMDQHPMAVVMNLLPAETATGATGASGGLGLADSNLDALRVLADPGLLGRRIGERMVNPAVAKLRGDTPFSSNDSPKGEDADPTFWEYAMILVGTGYLIEKAGQAGIPAAAAELAKGLAGPAASATKLLSKVG